MRMGGVVGSSLPRREDARFLTGLGTYTADVQLPGCLHAVFVRSPHAHALLGPVSVARAAARRGVVAVYAGRDLESGGVQPIPTAWLIEGMQAGERRALATHRVRHVGEAVAMVIGETAEAARSAADHVEADYEVLPAVADVELAVLPDAPTVYDHGPGNVCFEWSTGDAAATEAAFAAAATVVRRRLRNNRLIANAIEPRACVAWWNPADQDMTLWLSTQNPHIHRHVIGNLVLGMGEHRLRVISPDIGGAFGSKQCVYPEEVAVTWASRQLGRPVRWTARRSESFVTDSHSRDHATDAAIAFDASGRITGLRVRTLANLGANLSLFAPAIPTVMYGTMMSGQYRIPALRCEVTGVFTHTVPCDAYRGGGRAEATYVIERLMDEGARALGVDPAELRRRNLIQADSFPCRTAAGPVYDSGDYAGALETALTRARYDELRAEQHRLRAKGRLIGIGLSSHIDASGPGDAESARQGARTWLWEAGDIRVHPSGHVTVLTGRQCEGQGLETSFAQIVADVLDIPVDDVAIEHGDTAMIPSGTAGPGSRSASVGGSAIHIAALEIRSKAACLAAHLLGVTESELEPLAGGYRVRSSPGQSLSWRSIAAAAHSARSLPEGVRPGLHAAAVFDLQERACAYGTHIAVVEIDGDTGQVTLERYLSVDDAGGVINPAIIDGMLHGGIVQGVGQALWEEAGYDAAAQPLERSFESYALARADSLPRLETHRIMTPSPTNPLGVKGIGGAGAVAAPAAVANAVHDALAPLGVESLDMPFTAEKVWRAMRDATARRISDGGTT